MPIDDTELSPDSLSPDASDTDGTTQASPTGNDIADSARDQIGTLNYKTYGYSYNTPSGVPKDGPFIANTLDNAGFGFGGTPPSAADWADSKASIPGWSPVTDGTAQPGDVLATPKPMPLDWYRGGGQQLGIVSGQSKTIGITDNDQVGESDFGFRNDHNPVIWRNDQLAANANNDRNDSTSTNLQYTTKNSFDANKFADIITRNAQAVPHGTCATAIRSGFEQAGGNSAGHPIDAKNWGATLEKNGFTRTDPNQYAPQKGDIIVIQPYPGGNPSGHIAGYNGSQWVSDFKQNDMWGGPGYRRSQPPYIIYRSGR